MVVLTTSSAEEDILRSYKLHANAYVTKPVDLDQFMSAVRQIDEFFVQVVRLGRCFWGLNCGFAAFLGTVFCLR